MQPSVFVQGYDAPKINVDEILRYAGARQGSDAVNALLSECISEAEGVLQYSVCHCELPVSMDGDGLDLGGIKVVSDDLKRCLVGCSRCVLFCATVGMGMDRLIARYNSLSPAKALIMEALGNERVESLCDELCRTLKAKYGCVRPRFSPGYGDLPLKMQRDVFAVLDLNKRLGLTLSEGLIMAPSKSVTAIVGIVDKI